MDPLIGKMIHRYRVDKKLGEGGMAVVYQAFDTKLERPIVIKIIRTALLTSEEMVKRFEREARALAALSHPNIVKILDYGDFDNQPFLVMEYFPKGSLHDRMESGNLISLNESVEIVYRMANALSYAHNEQIIHRDIKPGNILLDSSNQPMLTDFGIAKLMADSDTVNLTQSGIGIGTPEYMSPEQGLGKKIDNKADIYTLGVVFYELLTGKKPFEAETPLSVVVKQISEPLPPIRKLNPEINSELASIVEKMLEKQPSDRYQNMQEVVNAIDNWKRKITTNINFNKEEPREKPAEAFKVQKQYDPTPQRNTPILPIVIGSVLVIIIIAVVAGGGYLIYDNYETLLSWIFPEIAKETIVQTPTSEQVVVLTRQPTQNLNTNMDPNPNPGLNPNMPPPEGINPVHFTFDNPNSGWEIGKYDDGEVGYGDSFYFVRADIENMVMWGEAGRNFENVIIHVDTTQIYAPENNNNDYGVICRLQPNGDGYMFSISGDGFYSIQKSTPEGFLDLVEWTQSDLINQGNTRNRLVVVCDREHLLFFINNTFVSDVVDTDFSSGDVALSATTYEEQPTLIHFDNVILSIPAVNP